MDIDLVVDPTPRQLDHLLVQLTTAGMYVSELAAHEALANRGMFHVVDPTSGWKADMIMRKARGFSETEFARREPAELLGVPIAVVTLEDLILSKLEWAKWVRPRVSSTTFAICCDWLSTMRIWPTSSTGLRC
jgi:hypothetical protein